MTEQRPIDQRITDALTATLTSQEIGSILYEVDGALEAASLAHGEAEALALDPLTPATDVQKHRKMMEDASFMLERLAKGREALNTRLDAVSGDEARKEKEQRYKAVLARQEAAAKQLRERYPVLAAEIAELLAECAAADRDGKSITGKLARVMAGWSGMNNPMERVKLPSPTHQGAYLWPKR